MYKKKKHQAKKQPAMVEDGAKTISADPKGLVEDSGLVSISQAAQILGVSIDTVRRWDKSGTLKSTRPDGKNRYFSIKELEAIKFAEPLTISEVSEQLNVSPSTLRRLETKGLISPERNEAGERVYDRESLEKFLQSQYFIRQKEVQEEILEPLNGNGKGEENGEGKTNGHHDPTTHAILGDHHEKISMLTRFRKISLISLGVIVGSFLAIIAIITLLFFLFPESTSRSLGYFKRSPVGKHFIFQSPDSWLARQLRPFSKTSLRLVEAINPELRKRIAPFAPIEDVNDVFAPDADGNVKSIYTFTVPDTSYLKIPDQGLIENLNADFVDGRQPGCEAGNLAIVGLCAPSAIATTSGGGGTTVVQTTGGGGSGDISEVVAGSGLAGGGAEGSVSLNVGEGLGLTVGSDTVALKINSSGSGLQVDSDGLSLIRSCSNNEVLKWNGTAWICAADGGSSSSDFFLAGDSGPTQTVSTNDTLTVVGGGGLSSAVSATDTVTLSIGAGSGITVNANDITLALQSNKGLEVDSNGLSFIDCATDQILKYNASNQWVCAADDNATSTTFLDSVFRIQDNGDNTKQIAFEASSITTGTTRTLSVQDHNGTLVVIPTAATTGQLIVADGSNIPQFVTLSGDATIAAGGALTLASTGVTAASYGSASSVATFTVDSKGRLTAASNTAIAITESAVSGEIEAVTAGAGLTGGGTQDSVTLDIGAGSGIVVNANDIAVNLTTSGTIGASSSNSGLEVSSSGLTLLKGCDDGFILKYTDAGGWACAADATGGTIDLQTAYVNGNTITTTEADGDIHFILDNTTTDALFDIDIAADSTGFVSIARNDGGNTFPTQLLRINNEDADAAADNGLLISGRLTDGIDLTDGNIVNAINLGANDIIGTTPAINFDNFDVSTAGTVTIAGGQAYTGTGAVTLSSAAGLTLDSGSNTLTVAASDTAITASGVTTLTLAPAASIVPSSAGSLTFGNGSTTTVTLDTDGTGDGELTVPDNSISNTELVNSSLTVTAGAGLTDGGTISLGGSATLNIGAGDGISVNANDIQVRLDTTAADGSTASSVSGLELVGGELSLIRGCSAGDVLKWDNSNFEWDCAIDAGGGASNSLQSAYEAGNTVTLSDAEGDFDIDIAAGSTKTVSISRLDGADTGFPPQLLLLENLDTTDGVGNGLLINAVGEIEDAIDVSDSDIINALNIGGNTILGTTASIDFSDFDMDSDGKIIFTSDNAGDQLNITTNQNDFQALVVNGTAFPSIQTEGIIDLNISSATHSAVGGLALDFTVLDSTSNNIYYGNSTNLTVNNDAVQNHTVYGEYINVTNNDAGSTVYGQAIVINDGAAGVVAAGLLIDNQQATDVDLTNGIVVQATTADSIVNAFNASDSEITNALNVGDNIITGTDWTIINTTDTAEGLTFTLAGGVGFDITGTSGQDFRVANTGGSIVMTSTESAVDSIKFESTLGGIQILASGAADTEDIVITATGSSIFATSTQAVSDAILLDASTDGGGIRIIAGDNEATTLANGNDIELKAEDDVILALTAGGQLMIDAATNVNSTAAAVVDLDADLTAASSTALDINFQSIQAATGTVNGLLITADQSGGTAAANTYTLNAIDIAAAIGACPATATCIVNDLDLQNTEVIHNRTDDLITFQGAGGTNNEALIFDLDSAAASGPSLYSNATASGSTRLFVDDNLVIGLDGVTTNNVSEFSFSGDDLYVEGDVGINGGLFVDGNIDFDGDIVISNDDPRLTFQDTTTGDEDYYFEANTDVLNLTNPDQTKTLSFDFAEVASRIKLESASELELESTSNTTTALVLDATAGGIQILASGAADTEDIVITATGSSIFATSTQAVSDAIRLNATAGGIDIDAANSTLRITNTSNTDADDFTIEVLGATDSSLVLSSSGTTADALQITASAGGIDILATGAAADEDIDIVATGSSVNITSTESIASAIVLTATTTAGGIDLNAGTSGISFDTTDGGNVTFDSSAVYGMHLQLSGDASEGLSGGGLTSCSDGTASKLLWSSATNKFSCGQDQGSSDWATFTSPSADQAEMLHGEFITRFTWNTAASSAVKDYFTMSVTNDATTDGGNQRLLVLTNNDDAIATGTTENLLVINNADANEAVTTGLALTNTGGGGYTTGLSIAGATTDIITGGTNEALTIAPNGTGAVQITSGVTSGIGTSSALSLALSGSMTTGTGLSITGAEFNPGAGNTANLANFSFTHEGSNTTGNSVVNGLNIAPTLNTTGATGTKELNGINVAAATITGCSGGNCTLSGVEVNTITSGAVAAITSNGLLVNATGIGAGTLNGLNISGITAGAGTENALSIGADWDKALIIGRVDDAAGAMAIDIDNGPRGTTINSSYDTAVTQTGNIVGLQLDYQTNFTALTTADTTTRGIDINTNPSLTNSTASSDLDIFGIDITGGTLATTTGTATIDWDGVFITNPNINQNPGTLTADGLQITTGTITNNGTQQGINIQATGVGAGTLNGLNISDITPGAGTQTAIKIGNQTDSGWDFIIDAGQGAWRGYSHAETNACNGGTSTVTEKALVYRLECQFGANSNSTFTYNITAFGSGNPGQFMFIVATANNSGLGANNTVRIQMNDSGSIVSNTMAPLNGDVVTETYTLVKTEGGDNGGWELIGSAGGGNAADLAEWTPSVGEKPQPGEVVSVVPGESIKVQKSTGAYDRYAIGIVSTAPHTTMGTETPDSVQLALAGRVPVKVSDENGPIRAGDYLTASSTPGVAMRATRAGITIGKAYEDFNGESGTIMAFVNTSHYSGEALAGLEAGFIRASDINGSDSTSSNIIVQLGENGEFQLQDKKGREIAGIDSLGNANFEGNVEAKGLSITNDAGEKVAGINSEGEGKLSSLTTGSINAEQVVGADLGEVYGTNDESISIGDVVAYDAASVGKVKKADVPYAKGLVGVVTSSPSMVVNSSELSDSAHQVIVTLAGTVSVKVSGENGPIEPGDPLTSSSTPGVAMKATKYGAIIGRASTGFSGEGTGTVLVIVSGGFGGSLAEDISALTGRVTALEGEVAGLKQKTTESTAVVPSEDTPVDLTNLKVESLNVTGDMSLGGGLVVGGDATFRGLTFFEKVATFFAKTIFRQDVEFLGRPTFNQDTAGFAQIKAGEQSVKVTFQTAYSELPVISLTLGDGKFAAYSYRNVTADGFEIVLKEPAEEELNFSWIALAVKGAQTHANKLP